LRDVGIDFKFSKILGDGKLVASNKIGKKRGDVI